MEVYRRRRKTQAFAGTTFAERLKPLFVYHFHRCIVNYHKVVQGWGCVCGIGGGGDGSVSDCWGGCEDATTNEGMGGLMIFYVKFTKLKLNLEPFLVSKRNFHIQPWKIRISKTTTLLNNM